MQKLYSIFLVLVMLLVGMGTAQATTLTATDIASGGLAGFATTSSGPGAFELKTLAGYTGVGVAGGYVSGEIDLLSEWIRIDFTSPTVISEFTVAFLFKDGNYGDTVSEVARVQYSDPWAAGDLSVITPTTATWSKSPGPITNLSLGQNDYAGVWEVSNPFGTTAVNFLYFTALQVGSGTAGAGNSDYSIVSVSGAPVPEAATMLLLGIGLLGLAGFRRKLRRS